MTDQNSGVDKRKIGIYGGAFNPVHNGHIRLAQYFFDSLKLDKLIFVPTSDPPHKSSSKLVDGNDRINMLKIAVKDIEGFEISDIEFKRKEKSYTYVTLKELKKIYPKSEFYLIIGADQFLTFSSWYKYKEILEMAVLCTAARELDGQRDKMLEYAKSLNGLEANRFYLSDNEVYKVSSSEIREKIKNGGDASEHLPDGVFEYIKEKRLYIE